MGLDLFKERIETYGVLGIACAVITVVLSVDLAMGDSGPFSDVWRAVGTVNLFFMLGSILGTIYFLYYFQHLGRFRSELRSLLDSQSKAHFLRNLDRIEYLAWKLGDEYVKEVQKRREGFGIKRKK